MRHPFALLLALALILWPLVSLWIWSWDLAIFTYDDAMRAETAAEWIRHPFFLPPDGVWLPFPAYVFGAWRGISSGWQAIYWYIPAASLMMAIGAAAIGLCAINLVRATNSRPVPLAVVIMAALLPLMIRDNWRVATTPLSEPPYLMLFAATALAVQHFAARRPERLRDWLLLLALLVPFQMCRYEGIALACVAWTTAWAFGRPRNLTRRGSALLLSAGWLALALFPIALMLFNRSIHGSALQFIATHSKYAATNQISGEGLPKRLAMVVGLMKSQGEALLAFALAGTWLGRKSPALAPILILLLAAWGINIAMAVTNLIGIATPSRFTLGFLWMCVPPALLLFDRLWTESPLQRLALLLALGAVLCLGFQEWANRSWEGRPFDDQAKNFLESLGGLARRDGYRIVLEDPYAFPQTNLLRLLAAPENVSSIADYSPARPFSGRFLYIYPHDKHRLRPELDARGVVGFYQWDIAYFDRMPPLISR